VSEVQQTLSQKSLTVVTGESGAGKTFGAVMAAAQSARLSGDNDTNKEQKTKNEDTKNAVVLYFSDFTVVCAKAGPGRSLDHLAKRNDANKVTYDREAQNLVRDAVQNTLQELKLPKEKEEQVSDGRRVVVVLDELGRERDVLRALCAMYGGSCSAAAEMSLKLQDEFHCGPVYFVAVGTGCDTALWQAGSSHDSYSTVAATAASGREVFCGIIDTETRPGTNATGDIRTDILRRAGSICRFDGNHDTAPTTHAWSAIGHALVGNARVAALVARGIIDSAVPHLGENQPSNQEATLEVEMQVILINAMRVFATLNGVQNLSVLQRNHAVAQAAALMFGATDADLPEDLEQDLCVRYGIVTSNAVRVQRNVPEGSVQLQPDDGACIGFVPGARDDVVCVPKDKPRYSVSPAHLVMLLLSFGYTARAATGVGFEHAIQDAIAVCMPAVIAARMWAESPNARLRKLATPSSRAVKLRGGAGDGPAVHPLFEVLYAAAEAKKIATMRRWVRGSAVARLEPTKVNKTTAKATVQATVKSTVEPTERSSFAEWLKLLDASIADPHQRPDAAVVLNGRYASGPDVVALFFPAEVQDSGALPAAVFVQCQRHQAPAETEHTWKESALAILDGFVQMGAPAFELSKCREALGLAEQSVILYAPKWRSTFSGCGATSELGAIDHAAGSQMPEEFKLRFAFNTSAATRGAEALGDADTGAYFVVVQCRAASAREGHAKGSDDDLQVERTVCGILKAHATTNSLHARCFYIRTHPGDKRFAPIPTAAF
jgi:hypothetical protein